MCPSWPYCWQPNGLLYVDKKLLIGAYTLVSGGDTWPVRAKDSPGNSDERLRDLGCPASAAHFHHHPAPDLARLTVVD